MTDQPATAPDPKPLALAALAAGLVAVTLIAGISWQTMRSSREAIAAVDRSRVVIGAVDRLQALIHACETASRGFLISGKDRYLVPYQESRPLIAGEFTALHALVATDAEQARRARDLDDRATRRVAFAERLIALQRAGRHDDGVALLQTDEGDRLTHEIRDLVAAMGRAERERLTARIAHADRTSTRAAAWLIGLVGLCAALVATSAALLLRHIRNQERLRAAISASGERARVQVAERTAELLKVQERLNLAITAGKVGIFTIDYRSGIIQASAEHMEMLGQPAIAGELPLATMRAIVHPEDQPRAYAAMVEAAGRGTVCETVVRFDPPGLPRRWLLIRSRPVADSEGRLAWAIGVSIDHTSLHQTGEALRESEERLRLALKANRIGTWGFDIASGTLEDSPDAAALITGDAATAMDPEVFFSFVHPDDHATIRTALHQALTVTGSYAVEYRTRWKDGSEHWLGAHASVVRDVGGRQQRMLGIVQDISERKRAELAIHELNLDLERRVAERTAALATANRELEAFSYSVSHDLRAPLRAIDGFAQALEEDCAAALPDDGRRYLARVRAGVQRMGELIDDLLKLSRITRAELKRGPVDLSALARAVADECVQRHPERAIVWGIADGLQAEGDAHLLRVLLENLLGNAVKFSTGRSPAHIAVARREAGGTTVFSVSDDGAGFDMAYADKLFGAFQRLHSAAEFPGTGIGLATVARIVHRHGGRIWAEGAVGEGATFHFTLS